jgi:hypothetical protein
MLYFIFFKLDMLFNFKYFIYDETTKKVFRK